MKVYSDVITDGMIQQAVAAARVIDGADIFIESLRTWKPRAWAWGTEFWAYSVHGTRASTHGPIEQGPRDHLPRAATWSDWGYVIARLYLLDSRARIGHYLDRDDFIAKVRADHAFSRRRESIAFLELLGESVPEPEPPRIIRRRSTDRGPRLTLQSAVTGEILGELSPEYSPGNPDYVSPALRNARRQQKESEELLDKWADPVVFGPPF